MTKLRSDITKFGISRTPHRAFMRAMGLDDEAIAKPMIGVVSMKGEQTPCNMTHGFQVEAAKQGVAEAGGTPPSPGGGDGVKALAMADAALRSLKTGQAVAL